MRDNLVVLVLPWRLGCKWSLCCKLLKTAKVFCALVLCCQNGNNISLPYVLDGERSAKQERYSDALLRVSAWVNVGRETVSCTRVNLPCPSSVLMWVSIALGTLGRAGRDK